MSQQHPPYLQLVPGSIWERTRRGKPSTYTTVLMVSNLELNPQLLDKFPQQVVFLSDSLKVLTQDVETFLATRTYYGSDAGIVNLIEALLSPNDQEPETDADDDEDQALSGAPQDDAVDIDSIDVGDTQIQETLTDDAPIFKPSLWNGVDLNKAFRGYRESPYHTGDTLHTLRFELTGGVTLDALNRAFDYGNAENSVAGLVIDTFLVDCNQEYPTSVVPDGFVGVFLEIDGSANGHGIVCLTSSGDFRARETQNPVETSTPQVLITPQHSPQPGTVIIPQLATVGGQVHIG